MTLSTPLIYAINAFDPSYEHTFEFSYSGAQAVSNRAVITDNETQTEIYNVKQDGLKLNHVLPANTLEAGKSYLIQIQVYDVEGNSSDLSSAVLFYCFTTPEFYFSNITDGDVISVANLQLNLAYFQAETEELKEYRYYVYDATSSEIYSSESFYTIYDMTHTIYGLKNESIYYIRAVGKTTHNMDLDTGMLQIIVRYSSYASNVAFEAENDRQTGCVILRTNIVAVDFELENENYTIADGMVDLTDNTLTYKVGAEDDFSLIIKAKNLPINSSFCWTTDKSIEVSIVEISGSYYCRLHVTDDCTEYNIFKYISTSTEHNPDTLMIFQIYRKNNKYDLILLYE